MAVALSMNLVSLAVCVNMLCQAIVNFIAFIGYTFVHTSLTSPLQRLIPINEVCIGVFILNILRNNARCFWWFARRFDIRDIYQWFNCFTWLFFENCVTFIIIAQFKTRFLFFQMLNYNIINLIFILQDETQVESINLHAIMYETRSPKVGKSFIFLCFFF